MIPTIVKSADEVVDGLKRAISDGGGQGEVLMKEQFSMYTLVIIGRVSCIEFAVSCEFHYIYICTIIMRK